jgi:hypothetical protein
MDRFGGSPDGGRATDGRVRELLVACVGAVGVDGAGMSLLTSTGATEPVFGTDDVAESLERLQFTLGEGPCLDASSTGSPVLVPDLADARDGVVGRWPMFLEGSTRAGVRAVFAFPIRIGAIALGAADLYRSAPGPMTRQDLARTLAVMDAVALTLLEGEDDGHPVDPAEQLGLVVHRAAGMVMVQTGSSIEEALMLLRTTAFTEGLAINALADDVVNGTRRFQEEQR